MKSFILVAFVAVGFLLLADRAFGQETFPYTTIPPTTLSTPKPSTYGPNILASLLALVLRIVNSLLSGNSVSILGHVCDLVVNGLWLAPTKATFTCPGLSNFTAEAYGLGAVLKVVEVYLKALLGNGTILPNQLPNILG